MARKKRKAVKSPPPPSHSAPHAEAGGHSAWLPPALGLLTLILAWLAALGGFADGTTDLRALFNVDSVYPRVQFRAFFGGADESARVSTGPAPYFFPDLLMLYAMAALGVGYASSLYLVPPLQAALSAVGWILVCDFLFGKSPARRFAVLFLHSLPLLIVAWRGADLFHVHLLSLFHYGAWAAMPWLLWFSLRVLESGEKETGRAFSRRLFRLAGCSAVGDGCQRFVCWRLVCGADGRRCCFAGVGGERWSGGGRRGLSDCWRRGALSALSARGLPRCLGWRALIRLWI